MIRGVNTFWEMAVPAGWQRIRVREAFEIINGFPFRSEDFNRDGRGQPLIRIRDILSGYTEVFYDGQDGLNYTVENGDIVVGMDGDFNLVWWESGSALLNQRLCALRSHCKGVDSRFAFYQLPIPIKIINDLTPSSTVKHLSSTDVAALQIRIPAPMSQKRIADFLDRETTRIGQVIEKKTQLKKLLEEKKSALINTAVTQGLKPNALMKVSCPDWVGMIRADWNLNRLKHLLERIDQGWSPQAENRPVENGEWGVLKVGCVNNGVFRPQEYKVLNPGIPPRPGLEVRNGDLLMSRGNTRDLVGSAAIAEGLRPRLMLSDLLYRLVLKERLVIPRFAALALSSRPVRYQIELTAWGSSDSMPKISQEKIRNLVLPVPPIDEQRAIIGRMARSTGLIDELSRRALESIDRLKEFRSALITAAVTGQIDVDTWRKGGNTDRRLEQIEEEVGA